MSSGAVCITNSVPELRSCTIRGEHLSNCDGVARRYNRETQQVELVTIDVHDDAGWHREYLPCGGCVPRPAESGLLCGFHARQAEAAMNEVVDLGVHLWSINAGPPSADVPVSSAFGSRWPLKDSRIRANEIVQHLLALLYAHSADSGKPEPYLHMAVSPFAGFRSDATTGTVAVILRDLFELAAEHGPALWKRRRAAAAVIPFVNAVGAAYRAYPTEDKPHRVPILRCRRCNQLGLVWHPPLFYQDDDRIKCEVCGQVENRAFLEHDIAVILDVRQRGKS